MRRIKNAYTSLKGYKCFGCAPSNLNGLQMEFFEDGEYIVSYWEPKDWFQGFLNILHGGIQTFLMDEIACWVVLIKLKTSGYTSRIQARFIQPVPVNQGRITLKARLKEMKKNFAVIEVGLFNADQQQCSGAEITYYTYSPEKAKQLLHYPGYDQF